ncbi:MAG: hypothetical protein COT85_06160 [Chlamydiae bacterium CG10_big_fil_rev_8_21_14_0_10_42_34]|nr:MAG: hypothetical protein COT85_06160 [Chlamydiae bacterium CG10_big_fil_rev_8_21_14_0_10_42_34]
MTKLILMRHGNTFEPGQIPVQVGARTDLPLTDHGRGQAEAMAKYFHLEGKSPAAIYAGNLKRQIESAQILAKSFDLDVMHEPALTEIDYGLWEGLRADEIANRWPKEFSEWMAGKWQPHIFGGTLESHLSAIENWLNRVRKLRDKTVFAVSSNGLLRFFKNEKVKTGHFCEIELFEGGLKIQKWNIDPLYGQALKSQMA